MSDFQIPNAVGRIDEIIEAIEQGDRIEAVRLVENQKNRLMDKHAVLFEQTQKTMESIHQISQFQRKIKSDIVFFDQIKNKIQGSSL